MKTSTANGIARFTRDKSCPVCGGSEDDPRGTGKRCYGFIGDGYIHCTREDLSGGCKFHGTSETYSHILKGKCRCGVEHNPAEPTNGKADSKPAGFGEVDRVYKYHGPDGKVLFEVVRFKNPKDFRQRRPVGNGGKPVWNLKGIETVLYHLPLLLAADPDQPVWVCEGEKDVENLEKSGRLATCNPMGAGKWRDHYSDVLKGRICLISPHNDKAGREHAQQVARSLHGVAASVKVVELPGLPEKGDVSDFLASGGTVAQLTQLASEAAEWDETPTSVPSVPSVLKEENWGDLKLGAMPPPIPFPVEVFPDCIRGFCESVAESIGCAIDFPATDIIAVVGAAIGRSYCLRLKDSYFASASNWYAKIGPPSDGKSPAQDIVAGPLRELGRSFRLRYEAELAQWEIDRAEAKKKKEPEPPPPVRMRVDVDDVTIEALSRIMNQNPRGIAWISDELAGCILSLNQYKPGGKGNDRQTLNKWWSGKKSSRDRLNESGECDFPDLTILGPITPGMVEELKDSQGRIDGFQDRYLHSFPEPSTVPDWTDHGVNGSLLEKWKDIINRLHSRDMAVNSAGDDVPNVVTLSDDARQEWIRLYNLHVGEMNAVDFSPSLRGPWGKYREIAARLALDLGCLRSSVLDSRLLTTLIVVDIQGAFKLINYFKRMFERVKFLIEKGSDIEDVRIALKWLRMHPREDFSERDLYREVRRFRDDKESMQSCLDRLKQKAVIRPLPVENSGGRNPSPRWEVNPGLYRTEGTEGTEVPREPGSDDDFDD